MPEDETEGRVASGVRESPASCCCCLGVNPRVQELRVKGLGFGFGFGFGVESLWVRVLVIGLRVQRQGLGFRV